MFFDDFRLFCSPTAGFEIIHGLVDRLMLLLEVYPMDSDSFPKYKVVASDGKHTSVSPVRCGLVSEVIGCTCLQRKHSSRAGPQI